MRIIPAIDIIDGNCIRLTKGDYSKKKIYSKSPLDIAKSFEDHGLIHLHLVDLDGAKSNGIKNFGVLESIAKSTNLIIDFGGGIKSDVDIQRAFNSGANQVTGGSIAVNQPEKMKQWMKQFGTEHVILGADVKEGKIAINGWQEKSESNLFPFIESYLREELKYLICTDISKDGMLQGPSLGLYEEIRQAYPALNLIASGGISCMEDLDKLNNLGLEGAIVGKAIYEGRISLLDLKKWIINN